MIRTILVRLYAVIGAGILLTSLAMMAEGISLGLFVLALFGGGWLLLFWCLWPFFRKSNA
jgi:hypothetical protein